MAADPDHDLRRQRLRDVPLFSRLREESLDRVISIATEFEAEGGRVLVQPGHEGAGMFVLEEGCVTVELPDGRIRECGPGEFFGELSILAPGTVRSARVRAAGPVRCLAVSRSDFAALLESEPQIAVAMLPVLARRLAEA